MFNLLVVLFSLTSGQYLTGSFVPHYSIGKQIVIVEKVRNESLIKRLRRMGYEGDFVGITMQNTGNYKFDLYVQNVALDVKVGGKNARLYVHPMIQGNQFGNFRNYFSNEEMILLYSKMSVPPGNSNTRVGYLRSYWKNVVGGIVLNTKLKIAGKSGKSGGRRRRRSRRSRGTYEIDEGTKKRK